MSRAQDLFDRLVAGGEAEVISFIEQPVTEELFLDYKRSADNGAGASLHNTDRRNLAKAISGFGNSEGGVIVWGVDCRNDQTLGDIPTAPIRVNSPVRFKAWLEQATSGLTLPPHDGVRHHAIAGGFVVSFVPAGSNLPYQTVGDLSYFIRAGSNFARAPHAVLAGMFGRKPQPRIQQSYLMPNRPSMDMPGRVKTEIGVILKNFGLGIADSVFLNLKIMSHPGRHCSISFDPANEPDVWWGRYALAQEVHMITRAGYPLPPEAFVMPLTVKITLQEPLERDFVIEGLCGAAGSQPCRFEVRCSLLDMVNAFDRLSRTAPDAADFEYLTERFNKLFYGGIPGA
jgi:hypothetical protein